MARSEARFRTRVWDEDSDWRELTPSAQWMYWFLISQEDMSHLGVLPLRRRRWARYAAGLKPDYVDTYLSVLVDRRYVVIDEDTEELLVRTLMRNDEVYRQPNVLAKARKDLSTLESQPLRAVLLDELHKIEQLDMPASSRPIVADMIGKLGGTPSSNPAGKGTGNPSPKGSAKGSPKGSASPPASDGAGRGTRLPEDFAVTTEMRTWAADHAPGVDIERETTKFRNYWTAKSGKDATKKRWDLTWRNWMLTAAERAPRASPARRPAASETELLEGWGAA